MSKKIVLCHVLAGPDLTTYWMEFAGSQGDFLRWIEADLEMEGLALERREYADEDPPWEACDPARPLDEGFEYRAIRPEGA